ncbi:aldo/keto reductase [Actinoplanes sp. RD1]|uniref:aldo/keto reductase n=1 Tax=Actinoplanes sp. RD1 TaxID=3064538 RepID=UPI0027404D96|nr:aldo/keto reductase [Actinoplanes sp. RD1]
MTDQPTRTLADGVEIPYLGFGTYLIPDDEAADAVAAAIAAGYRHIDTAEVYANERGVGEGLRRGLAAAGLSRDDVFVTTKLWPQGPGGFKSARETLDAFDVSLDKLGLDHVDLYLIHAPYEPGQRLDQWRALVELHENKRARTIGVSNFNAAHIEELAAAGLPLPHANQIELHPWSQKPGIVSSLAAKNITPIAYSSLAPLSTWRTAPGHGSSKTDAQRAEGRREDSPFKTMAAKYGVTEAQLLLRWGVQKGYPVLPKSTKPARMRENADLFSFRIDDTDMATLDTMDRGDGLAWDSDPTHAG